MRRGLRFTIPNQYGQFLKAILSPIPLDSYQWNVVDEESYIVKDGQLDRLLFPESTVIDGHQFAVLLTYHEHYLIFVDIKAFHSNMSSEIVTYEDFLHSTCEFALLVIDSQDVTIYCKDPQTLNSLYENAFLHEFEEIAYITSHNDSMTRLSCW
ncbi:MAG: DUF2691 family protein [Exiguobacterium sp.]|nr:DUF2691 family protein [Exiguobacterium sp.]MBR2758085.1 DUF2691 family protein [Exiguobacterium sp.]MBR3062076.1 DUF2691 family protein [Exiguobacterium sp.]MBR3215399.1 DUF2691 family protein [Exiguobacterium sp.]MBR3320937.1 DUF2691 family protein [Exiguobacterium sp.]